MTSAEDDTSANGLLDAFADAGNHSGTLAGLSGDPAIIAATVQGLLIHADHLDLYGGAAKTIAPVSRETRPLSERLDLAATRATELSTAYLTTPLPIPQRQTGTCRDYAVMTAGFLRALGITARVRCGFADYFSAGTWEDHWLCEFLNNEQRWQRIDAQLDGVHRGHLQINFDICDVPAERYIAATDIAGDILHGRIDPDLCGHGEATGQWFVYVNVMRDLLVLQGWITSGWDRWREIPDHMKEELREPGRLNDLIGADAATLSPMAPF